MANEFEQITVDVKPELIKLAKQWSAEHDGVKLSPNGMIKVLIKHYRESLGVR